MSGQAGAVVVGAVLVAAEKASSQKIAIAVGIGLAIIVVLVVLGALLYAVGQAFVQWVSDAVDQPGWYLGVPAIPGVVAFIVLAAVQPNVLIALAVGAGVSLIAGIWVAGS